MIKTLNIEIWGRDFSLNVEYDCYVGEGVTPKQMEAVKWLANTPSLFSMAKEEVIKYCKVEADADDENQKKDNIFSYVKPEAIFVKRDELEPRIALMCKYRYDIEHGLAIVFDTKGTITVVPQDVIL